MQSILAASTLSKAILFVIIFCGLCCLHLVEDFIALLNVVVVHNALLHTIDLEARTTSITLGAEEIAMGMLYQDKNTIPKVLQAEFKRLVGLQSKCDGMVRLADRCPNLSAASRRFDIVQLRSELSLWKWYAPCSSGARMWGEGAAQRAAEDISGTIRCPRRPPGRVVPL